MPTLSDIKTDILALTNEQQANLLNYISEILSLSPVSMQDCREARFSKGKSCPHCESHEVFKYGTSLGKQRYKCKSCLRTFTDLSKSVLSSSKLPLTDWLEYAKCMILGFSIRRAAIQIGVCVKTSFYMRHRILDAIRPYIGMGHLEGVVEMDETYIAESFKGNHVKSGFIMPRPSRKRGKEVTKRGISSEQVCVLTGLDRQGNIYAELVCKGRMKSSDLSRALEGHIEVGSILCTDSHQSYIQFVEEFGLEHKRIESGKRRTDDFYNIQRLNSFHSRLKLWLSRFKGVSTKYLVNYLYWMKWLEYFKDDKEVLKGKNMLLQTVSSQLELNINDYRTRQALFR